MQTTYDCADFYLGRGPDAEYLGSLVTGGAPEDIEIWERFQSLDNDVIGDKEFRAEVVGLIPHAIHGVRAVWPWRYDSNSAATMWCYMFDRGTLYVYRYGAEMARIVANATVAGPNKGPRVRRPALENQFPIMIKPDAS